MLREDQRPHPGRSYWCRVGLEDAADNSGDGQHVEIVVASVRLRLGKGADLRKAGGKPKYIKPGRVPLWNWGRASHNPLRGDARGSGLRKGSQSSGDFIDLRGHEQNPGAQRYLDIAGNRSVEEDEQ
jgi:hypothetical protein